MKKTFSIKNEKKAPARQVEAIKHEIKKYIARERRKDLPEGFDFWDFQAQMGADSDSKQEVHVSQINKSIDDIISQGKEEFYLELTAEAKKRQKKVKQDS